MLAPFGMQVGKRAGPQSNEPIKDQPATPGAAESLSTPEDLPSTPNGSLVDPMLGMDPIDPVNTVDPLDSTALQTTTLPQI